MLDDISQIKTILSQSKNPLILLSENPSCDAIASGLALYSIFKKAGKNVSISSFNFCATPQVSFLKNIDLISKGVQNLNELVISLDTAGAKIGNISHIIKDGKLDIAIAQEEGFIKTENIKFISGKYKYDAVFALDTEHPEKFGDIFSQNSDFFYKTPIVNIDHKPENARFGQINFTDITKTSVAEIIFQIFKDEVHLFDEHIATQILTGIISKTKGFRTENITPRLLETASILMTLGAKREEIIENLYRQQTVPILKLWGKALTNLKSENGIVWSVLTREDFIKSGAEAKHLRGVIEELISGSEESEIIAIISEEISGKISTIINCGKNYDAKKFINRFGGELRGNEISFEIKDKNLIEAEQLVLEEIKKIKIN
jgi:phosphoesterase RecJ-like protein